MGRNVSEFSLTAEVLGYEISVRAVLTGGSIQVMISGGMRPHIGAVSIAGPDGQQDIEFPGHKDGVITRKWADILKESGFCPVVVTAGIHYDNLSKEGINVVLNAADALLNELLDSLKDV